MELSEALFNLIHEVRLNMLHQVKMLDLDMSPMHLKTMKAIAKIDNCTGQQLAKFMGRDKAQINRLIKELVSQGLVEKVDNENDKRSHLLFLSEAGQEVMAKFSILENQIFTTMVEGVAPEQIEGFIETANLLRTNLATSSQKYK